MKKNILIILAAVILIAVFAVRLDFQPGGDAVIDEITSDSKVVTISIRCDEILENYDKLDPSLRSDEYVPPDGIILAETEYALRDGDTVYDILYRAVRQNKIQFDFQGSDQSIFGSVYVRGINNLYERSCGPKSGWVYMVNGKSPGISCSKYVPGDGDKIEWVYTLGEGGAFTGFSE